MTEQPFWRVLVTNRFLGGTVISWELSRDFDVPPPWWITVEFGRAPTDEVFAAINDQPLADVLGVVVSDDTQRLLGIDIDTFYRIRLDADAGTFVSAAMRSGTRMPRRDWLIGRHVVKHQTWWAEKYAGVPGLLYKRRVWGEPCPGRPSVEDSSVYVPCREVGTGEELFTNCPTCFGTGIKYGYYAPMTLSFGLHHGGSQRQISPDLTRGTVDDFSWTASVTSLYELAVRDVLIDLNSDRRFTVRDVRNTDYRGVPLIQNAQLRQLPAGDPAYQLDRSTVYGYEPYAVL